ncbi:hypothetical protein vBKpnAMK4_00498 [Klebsiella phage vB_Kpn_AM_K4]
MPFQIAGTTHVVIILDNDKSGNEAAKKLAKLIRDKTRIIPDLVVGENVKVIGGKWVGHNGVIVKVVNRNDGKSGYKIYREDFGDYIHCLKKFVESSESYLRKWVHRVRSYENHSR